MYHGNFDASDEVAEASQFLGFVELFRPKPSAPKAHIMNCIEVVRIAEKYGIESLIGRASAQAIGIMDFDNAATRPSDEELLSVLKTLVSHEFPTSNSRIEAQKFLLESVHHAVVLTLLEKYHAVNTEATGISTVGSFERGYHEIITQSPEMAITMEKLTFETFEDLLLRAEAMAQILQSTIGARMMVDFGTLRCVTALSRSRTLAATSTTSADSTVRIQVASMRDAWKALLELLRKLLGF